MTATTRTLLRPLLGAALLATSLIAQAEQYLVELLVFSQPGAQLVPASAPGDDWSDKAVVLEETARSDIRAIDPLRHQLEGDARKLESNGYQIKLHQAWLQPADAQLNVAVRQGHTLAATQGEQLYPAQGLISLSDNPLSAKVTLWLNHATAAEPVSERLQVSRRLRLDETHYLDHRSLGALIRVSRP